LASKVFPVRCGNSSPLKMVRIPAGGMTDELGNKVIIEHSGKSLDENPTRLSFDRLWDFYAGHALAGLLAHPQSHEDPMRAHVELASEAADLMMAARRGV